MKRSGYIANGLTRIGARKRTLSQIFRIRSCHDNWPRYPAISLNHDTTDLGIPIPLKKSTL